MRLLQDVSIALDFLYRSKLFESLPEHFQSGNRSIKNGERLSTI